jgi:exonuclease-1
VNDPGSQALRAESVAYVVAPYEADAQLAYLERQGFVDGVLTEDSDLLVYGCRTVLFKMDAEGRVCLLRRDRLGLVGAAAEGAAATATLGAEWRMDGWGDAEFRHMAVRPLPSFLTRMSMARTGGG